MIENNDRNSFNGWNESVSIKYKVHQIHSEYYDVFGRRRSKSDT